MQSISLFVYNLFLPFYYYLLWLAAFFHPKAKKWIQGQKAIWPYLKDNLQATEKRIWVHVASLGEFEQGRPIIEALKKQYPKYKIVLTFFSPSGYEVRKNYAHADYVCYIPLDSKKSAKKFLQLIQPKLVVFVKYEFWYHFLTQANQQNIPIISVSAIFRPQQIFFTPYGQLFRKILNQFSHIFVQNQTSLHLLSNIGIKHTTIAPDSRFDRVFQNSQQVKELPVIKAFKGNRTLFVGGSTWPKGEELLAQLCNQTTDEYCFVIAPHEIKEKQMQSLTEQVNGQVIRYSTITNITVELPKAKVLIIDNIGMLSAIYQYGDFAYIGGGFGVGLHNTLEAAVFGMPIFIGPNHQRFQEACELVDQKGAFVITDFASLQKQFVQLQQNTNEHVAIKQKTNTYVIARTGGTALIMQHVQTQGYLSF